MLPVQKETDLRLARPEGATESACIQAASGLAILNGIVYVIADDEAYLAIFPDMGRQPGTTVDLLDVDISTDPAERKKHKPDLESLTPLQPFGRFRHGGIIALGSGSGSGRDRGAFAILDRDGRVRSTLQLDAGPLIEELAAQIPGLNLEGTAVTGEVLRVFQRGNDADSYNAHIDLDLWGLRETIASSRPLSGDLIVSIHQHDLGQTRGVKLCFSDADTLADGRIVFSASAEADEGSIDGEVAGSAVGIMLPGAEIVALEPIDVNKKVEGLAASVRDDSIHAYMVSDDDDPENPSALMRTTLPNRGFH